MLAGVMSGHSGLSSSVKVEVGNGWAGRSNVVVGGLAMLSAGM